MSEIRWEKGKELYDREAVFYMLETQRAMIYNDVTRLLITQAEEKGLKGVLTDDGNEIIEYLKNSRKVIF